MYKKIYKGKWVRVTTDGTSKTGILREAKYEYITLLPCVINETLGLDDKSLELRLETKIPTMISQPIKVIEPLSEDYIKKSLERYPTKNNNNQLSLF